ncbi:F-box/kelch-repeat protein [Cardamine amara subsp. amara]|uniref:F-box/kelch-repeat protein n=1 Tax=Cardamine amara subsp. amara TaxID=228776 RepID=A0ABD1AK61_CARAN
MKWKRLDNIPEESFCRSLVTFRGRFYANFLSRQIAVIDTYSLEVTLLLHSPQKSVNYLVPSGNDELFLVELTIPRPVGGLHIDQLTLRVSRLQEKASTWVEISDLGDRVLFINELGHFSCSAKELPQDCGVSGNSIFITHGLGKLTFAYKYGVHTGNAEDDLNCWRYSRENRVMRLHTSFSFIALMVGR